ncbi:MAG: hypothetical protein NC319_09930 [Butyricicoccus sp.]|nr:hypothetical protein [Butyricicoccus sp.]
MAEKNNGLSVGMIIGSIAVGAAAGVFYYYRKAQIKKLAEDIIARVKPASEADGETGDWDISAGAAEAGAADVNIVDSGISLESVEKPEDTAEAEAESEPEADGEAGEEPETEEAAGGAGADEQPESEAGAETEAEEPGPEQTKKKTWFWSK